MAADMSPAHQAVEHGDLARLVELVRTGHDIHEECEGLTLLHHAIDVELDAHAQTGDDLHVDTTAVLLALGADPRRRSGQGTGVSAEHVAFVHGHWLATLLFENWPGGNPQM